MSKRSRTVLAIATGLTVATFLVAGFVFLVPHRPSAAELRAWGSAEAYGLGIAERVPGKVTFSKDVCADDANFGGTLDMELHGTTPQEFDRTLQSLSDDLSADGWLLDAGSSIDRGIYGTKTFEGYEATIAIENAAMGANHRDLSLQMDTDHCKTTD